MKAVLADVCPELSVDDIAIPKRYWNEWLRERKLRMFRDELYERTPVVESPLRKMWELFTTAPSWQSRLHELLVKLENALAERWSSAKLEPIAEFKQQVARSACTSLHADALRLHERINNAISWPPLPAHATQQEKDYRSRVASAMESMRRFLVRQAFGRCFLVVGGVGSGKTYSIAEFIEFGDLSQRRFFLLPLHKPVAGQDQDIVHSIERQLQDATGDRSVTMHSLETMLGSHADGTPIRVVFAIDNVDQWVDEPYGGQLRDVIEQYSRGDHIYWLFTVQETRYHAVRSSIVGTLLEIMGFGFEAIANLLPHIAIKPHQETIGGEGHTIGMWLLLDALNRTHDVGLKILNENAIAPFDASIPKSEINDIIQQPLFAWILRDLAQKQAFVDWIRLRQVDLVFRFWRGRLDSLPLPGGVTKEQVQDVVEVVAALIVSSRGSPLVPKVHANAARVNKTLDHNSVEKALLALERSGLVTLRESHAQITGDVVRSLERHISLFWELRIAARLRNSSPKNNSPITGYLNLIEEHILPLEQELREGILQFFLLLVNADPPSGLAPTRVFLETRKLPGAEAAVWFAGPQASMDTQTVLAREHLSAEQAKNPHLLFAYLYFCTNADAHAVSVINRFGRLAPHLNAIQATSLPQYFHYFATRHLQTLKDFGALHLCLRHLFNAGVLEVCDKIAETAANVLFKVTQGIAIAVQSAVAYADASPRTKLLEKFKGRSFREWFLCYVARRAIDSQGPRDAYELMASAGWVKKTNTGGNFDLRKEGAIALGRWYRNRQGEQTAAEFMKWYSELAQGASGDAITFAFFVGVHALRDQTERGLPGDPRIAAPLVRLGNIIKKGPEGDRIVKGPYRKVFELNAGRITKGQ